MLKFRVISLLYIIKDSFSFFIYLYFIYYTSYITISFIKKKKKISYSRIINLLKNRKKELNYYIKEILSGI